MRPALHRGAELRAFLPAHRTVQFREEGRDREAHYNPFARSQDLYGSRWRTFGHVILPLSLPGVMAGCTFAFVLSMGDFIAPQLLGGSDSQLMVSNLVWSLFGVAYNWPLGAAVSVIMLLLTLTLLWLASRLEARWNYTGAKVGAPASTA